MFVFPNPGALRLFAARQRDSWARAGGARLLAGRGRPAAGWFCNRGYLLNTLTSVMHPHTPWIVIVQ